MNAPKCSACDMTMQADSYLRHQNGKRSGEQTSQRVTFGFKCVGCSDTVRLAEAVIVPVKVGW